MVIKLNSYILPENIVDKMKTKIEETREKKIELGFGLCRMRNTNIIRPGKDCTGTECALTQIKECPSGLYIGGYHTHPRTGTKPSIADLAVAYYDDVGCIGSVKENDIKCIVRTGPIIQQGKQEINDALENIEELLPAVVSKEEFQKWDNTRDDLINKYFKVVEVK